MKKFVLITLSESSEYYTYFIEHPQKPTTNELREWLEKNGCHTYSDDFDEAVVRCHEIPNEFKVL